MTNYFLKNKNFQEPNMKKFLIKSGITAPQFEENIAEQEKGDNF